MNGWIPNKIIFRIVIGIFAVSVLIYVAALTLVYNKRGEIATYSDETQSMLAKEENSLKIKSILDNNSDSIKYVRNFFIEKGDEITFIETIEKVAKNAGVRSEISSITQAQNRDPEKEDIRVKVAFEGAWSRVATFLDELEKMPFGVVIQNINLDSKDPGKWSGMVEFIVYREK